MTMNRRPPFLILFSFLSIGVSANAQEINWTETRLSVSAHWLIPQKEFGRYWKNGPGLGAFFDVPLNETFSFVGLGGVSWHAPSETPRTARIPHVLLFKLGVGLHAQHKLSSFLDSSLGVSLLNNAFIFSGSAAPDDFDNRVESEFGVSLSARFDLTLSGVPRLGLMAAYEPIFTGPDAVATFSVGAVISLF